jgi:hypothetical protein
MMEQEKKTPVSTPQATALSPAPAPTAAVASAKSGGGLTREKRLAIVVLGSFIALAAGVYAVKVLFKSKPPDEVVQTPAVEPMLEMPPQVTRQTPLEPSQIMLPPTIVTTGGFQRLPEIEPPPIVLPMDPMKETPIILPPEMIEAPIIQPVEPKIKDPLAIDPPIVDVPSPKTRKDVFSNAKKEGGVKIELPDLDQPPIVIDPPVAKNPVIRVKANDPKKEAGPKLELPAIPDPPLAIDVPLVIDPPTTKELPKQGPPAIDTPIEIKPPMTKKDSPAVSPPIVNDPPMAKKYLPVIEPPIVVDLPMEKKSTPELNIELKAPPIVPQKVDAPGNSNEYDEDLHPFKKDENYRSISRQYYNSDAYALALQRYNREHPGQADYVRLPPIWVLEKKYAADIAPRSTSNAPPPSVDLMRNEQIYTVGDNGEMLADIAKKTLGSEDAWKRIWDMNSQLNPAKMIPGGTRLRVP